ncbi:MAG: hypothetical protein P1V19_07875 [Gimesia sp.]|nr:hypothetical protein [Gimesia sp.]
MDSLLKLCAGIFLCLPLTGCVGQGYYDPSTGLVSCGEFYGPTNMVDDIRCSLSKHRAHRLNKRCCNPCDSCCTTSCGKSIPGLLASGTFNYGWDEGTVESQGPQSYATDSSCPHCQSGAGTFTQESSTHESYMHEGAPAPPTTVVPKKISPVPDHGPKSTLETPAPAPGAEEPMSKSTYVPPALLNPPSVLPSSAAPQQRTRRVQWVPAQIH